MSWLRRAAQATWKVLLEEDDGENPDVSLARALGGSEISAPEQEQDDDDPYAELARVDQVLHFFEYEAAKLEGYISDEPKEFADELERKRQEYYNMVNSIEVQHQRIAGLVGDLLRARTEFKERRRKELIVEIEQIKMDIGDCKTKRFFKDKQRREVYATLTPMITRVQTARLIAESEFNSAKAEVVSSPTPTEAVCTEESTSSSFGGSSVRRRGKQRFTDAELTRLLKED
eukprot:TRINITY_DN44289_c0_g1_i1.p1 TRINITY_DN44289_c0_g1~~TRINITY_DN44289_c0_g1_i1.p1  ORF type:complete len:231 (-),score=59.81 TRINITY_DN44289_c0_g1_i1:88-780(-)